MRALVVVQKCLVATLMAALLLSCGGRAEYSPLTNQPRHLLFMKPADYGRNFSLSQIVTGRFERKSYSIRFEIRLSGDELIVVGISEFGVTLFKIVQSGMDIHIEPQNRNNLPFDPAYLLSDIYLTYWPLGKVEAAYSAMGLRFQENSSGNRRVFGQNGELIAQVIRSGVVTRVQHFDHPYELMIRTLMSEGLR